MTWQLGLALGGGAAVVLAMISYGWYVASSLREAAGKVAAAQVAGQVKVDHAVAERDVERRLRKEAELQRDNALADAGRLTLQLAAARAVGEAAVKLLDAAKAAEIKETLNAVANGTLADVDAELDRLLR